MTARILVVDDEPDIRSLIKDILEDEGFEVDVAENAEAADAARRRVRHQLVLLDIWMPGVDGVSLLKRWKANSEDRCPVVMMSGHGTVETAVEATRYGAVDFVEKPLSMAKLLTTVNSALAQSDEGERGETLAEEQPVGNSRIVQALKQRLLDLRDSSQPVFISGPAGSGRRIWAAQLSAGSGGMDTYDGSSPLETLLPLTRHLYIADIQALNPTRQAELYEAIVGAPSGARGRFIVASREGYAGLQQDPRVDPRLARFWRDAIEVPALADHIEDIPELLEYYANWYSDREQLPYRHFDVAAQNLLRNQRWTGDIAQLKKFVRAILLNDTAETITMDEIEQLLGRVAAEADHGERISITIDMNLDLREARESFERQYLEAQLVASDHKISELARRVGQERTHLYRKLKSLGLQTKKQ